MVELAYTGVLKTPAFGLASSSLVPGTLVVVWESPILFGQDSYVGDDMDEMTPGPSPDDLKYSFWKDQKDAAEEQAADIAESVRKALNMRGVETESIRTDANQKFYDTYIGSKFYWMANVEAYEASPPLMCQHISLDVPGVWVLTMADPDIISCAPCAMDRGRMDLELYPDRCDNCLREGVSMFYETMIRAGNFMVSGNICQDCVDRHNESIL